MIARLPFEKVLSAWALIYRALRRQLPDANATVEHDKAHVGMGGSVRCSIRDGCGRVCDEQ